MNVAVYCGSRDGNNPIYLEKARELGEALAEKGYGIVYGGAQVGLMGAVADSALEKKGKVYGVMPEHLKKEEVVHHHLTEIYYVDTMHTRKAKMMELSDAFIAFPGGCGTLDEYFEVFTWAQIGLHQKPVILFNVNNFYDALIQHFQVMLQEGFVRKEQESIFKITNSVDEVMELLEQYIPV